ncbi:hypothetical protein Fmac_016080 [Flemingia macrophylla]|uniref:Uncharacterized protein n=1 Tax=Flemingia macrophylla TaxID=520843 RepID=A0ABD1MGG0_9FABA
MPSTTRRHSPPRCSKIPVWLTNRMVRSSRKGREKANIDGVSSSENLYEKDAEVEDADLES